MGLRFNPSSNKYTDMALQSLFNLALDEYSKQQDIERRKPLAEDERKFEVLKSMLGFGSIPTSGISPENWVRYRGQGYNPLQTKYGSFFVPPPKKEFSWTDKEIPKGFEVSGYTSSGKPTLSRKKEGYEPVQKSEEFKEGSGLEAYFNKNVAKITPRTRRFINRIKTERDLNHFLDNEDDYRESGVDVNAVKEYFGLRY